MNGHFQATVPVAALTNSPAHLYFFSKEVPPSLKTNYEMLYVIISSGMYKLLLYSNKVSSKVSKNGTNFLLVAKPMLLQP